MSFIIRDSGILERQVSMMDIIIRDLRKEKNRVENKNLVLEMKLKYYQFNLKNSYNVINDLIKENKKIRKKIRPNFLKRILNKLKIY